MSGVVAYTCNPATLEAEFQNGVGSILVRGNSPSIGGWIVTTCNPALGEEPDWIQEPNWYLTMNWNSNLG